MLRALVINRFGKYLTAEFLGKYVTRLLLFKFKSPFSQFLLLVDVVAQDVVDVDVDADADVDWMDTDTFATGCRSSGGE